MPVWLSVLLCAVCVGGAIVFRSVAMKKRDKRYMLGTAAFSAFAAIFLIYAVATILLVGAVQ